MSEVASHRDGHVLRGQGMLALSSMGQLVISLITIGMVGRWLTPSGFALFGLVGSIFSISRDMLDLGSTSVATKLLASRPERSGAVLGVVLAWRLVLALIGIGLVLAFAFTSVKAEERVIVCVAGLVLGTSVMGAFNAIFTARHRQTWPAVASIAVQGGGLLALVFLKQAGADERGAVWAIIAREAVWWVVVAMMGVRLLGGLPERPRSFEACRPVVGPGVVLGLAVLAHQVLVQGDVVLARWIAGEQAAAAIAASARPIGAMVALPWIAATPLIAVAAALASRPSDLHKLIRSAVPLALSMGTAVALLGAASAPGILTALYGTKYASDPEAVQACRAFCVVLGAAVAASAPAMLLVGMHRERQILLCTAIPVLLASGMKVALLPGKGAGALAMTTAGAEVALAISLFGACMFGASDKMASPAPADEPPALLAGQLLPMIVAVVWTGGVLLLGSWPLVQLACGLCAGMIFLTLLARSSAARAYREVCRDGGEGAR